MHAGVQYSNADPQQQQQAAGAYGQHAISDNGVGVVYASNSVNATGGMHTPGFSSAPVTYAHRSSRAALSAAPNARRSHALYAREHPAAGVRNTSKSASCFADCVSPLQCIHTGQHKHAC
jgi:hypothetical protein